MRHCRRTELRLQSELTALTRTLAGFELEGAAFSREGERREVHERWWSVEEGKDKATQSK